MVIDSIFNNFSSVAHGYISLDRLLPDDSHNLSTNDFRKLVAKRKVCILKTHTPGDFSIFQKSPPAFSFLKEEIFPYAKIIYVQRDGRDILNSLFFYMIAKGFNYSSFSEFLRSKNTSEGAFMDLSRVKFLRMHTKSWNRIEHKLNVSYEDLNTNFFNTMKGIGEFLGLELKAAPEKIQLKEYLKIFRGIRRIFPSFFNSTAILPGKGGSGGWEENFTDADLEYYNSIIKGGAN